MNTKYSYLLMAIFGLAGVVIGAWLFGGESEPQSLDEHIAEVHTNEAGEIVYTCSMHPQIRQNEPGNCPICGMDLIPADDNNVSENPNSLVLSEAAVGLAEIETTPVISAIASEEIRLPGKVSINWNNSSSVTSHLKGRIIDLYVDFEGDFVEKGQRMASIYSPELMAAQQELLETAKVKNQNPTLYNAARRKLELWELPISTIDEIEESKQVMESVDIVSPVSGYVESIFVDREQHVIAGSLMYQIVDLTSVWVLFDVFEQDIAKISNGQNIEFTTASYPGRTFTGMVDYINPMVDNARRTVEIRVQAENPSLQLKPNMLVEGVITASNKEKQLLIPRSAVMWTGTRSIVFVEEPNTEEPTFTAREVVLGERVGNQFIVLEGLGEGERVVTNGTFKLDSAAQLADKLSMMNRTPGSGANRSGHEGHAMPENTPSTTQDHSDHQTQHASTIPEEFKNQLKDVVSHYLSMKDAFVESNSNQASASATEMLNSLSEVDMALLKGDTHLEWMRFLSELTTHIKEISGNPIDKQRAAFSKLSPKLIEVVKHFEINGVFYQQFCPMSNDGEGAYWLSEQEEIANPYFGSQMHNCGETITKIEF
ncbi:MAG: efflux RND transporter periplasmic adaptor subunit [Balneolaceae bacterium]|nr:efflux RND transporter periplasmic adaptor subunit [Balneolaceae bacterium]